MRRAAVVLALLACRADPREPVADPRDPVEAKPHEARPQGSGAGSAVVDPTQAARDKLVDETIVARGIKDARVIAALRRVPRHELMPADVRPRAYEDSAVPIGWEQTISQPYIVAAMTEAAHIAPGAKVLEIGTGSGYQAAVIAEMGADVYTIEIVEPLAKRTHAILDKLGYAQRMHLRIGDGYRGWPEAAPFDAIIVTAAPDKVPQPLIDQLSVGGRLVIPVGGKDKDQDLRVITRNQQGVTSESLYPVRFVPMTGEAQQKR